MRAAGLAAVAAIACTAAAASAQTPVVGTASVALSSHRAGARPVATTVTLTTELRCGRLSDPSVSLVFPAGERLPRSIPATAVRVGGVAAAGVGVAGRTVSITLARPQGVVCDVIAIGPARIVVTRGARLGNPRAPGRYALVVRTGAGSARATITITR